MVVENPLPPLFEWLLGPYWRQGTFFFHGLAPWISLVLVVLMVVGLVGALRRGPGPVTRAAIRVLVAGSVVVGFLLSLVAALWFLDFGGSQARMSPVVKPTVGLLERLLGAGWYEGAVYVWLLAMTALAMAALLIGWLVAALRRGPVAALRMTDRLLIAAAVDLAMISPRRVFALSRLAFKESIRRRTVVVFAVFILVLLFAGWFLDPASSHPAQLYLSFVLTAVGYLVLILVLLLSALSLPADIKNKTLHTVVTKPVRPSEIVLGRMLGFVAVGTVLLVVMGLVSYVFVVRGLSHTHQFARADVEEIENVWSQQAGGGKAGEPLKLVTRHPGRHTHDLYVKRNLVESSIRELNEGLKAKDLAESERNLRQQGWRKTDEGWLKEGRLRTETTQDHWHEFSYHISADEKGDCLQSSIESDSGPLRGMLVARVPLYGKLRFKDRAGRDVERGINVGDEWSYRSFIAGGSLAAAIWNFKGITEDNFPEAEFPSGLPLEMSIEVFRTFKGDTTDPKEIRGVLGSLAVCSPKPGAKPIEVQIFPAKDFATDVHYIPRKVETSDGRTLDLFEDVAVNGHLEVWLRCVEPAQYFGAAQADLYFRARDASFPMNLAKGYVGIWLQMVMVVAIGVMFSTFLSGPIALVATLGALAPRLLFPAGLLEDLASGEAVGGGPVEAFIRLITQQNVVTPMEPGVRTRLAEMADQVLEYGLRAASAVLPEFGQLSFSDWVAHGFDVSGNMVWQCSLHTLAFLLPVFVAGYFFLKTREVAK
ncbi:MAG: hypothetical protein A2V70_06870 [Planctomycetes bacterium RBG_13_63_9]|nr:MAG: hypothetical protein A2V70_06870 [Planctomycetes bacterium RBG_13_63_9]